MIQVNGADELIAKLEKLKTSEAKKAIRKGSRIGCKDIQQEAKAVAPKVTGNLQKNIKTRAMKKNRKKVGSVVKVDGAAVPYAGPLQYGTKKMEANPFLTTAAERKGESARETAMRITAQEIEKSMKQ